MPEYTVEFYNDMGHLRTSPDCGEMPDRIFFFACQKVRSKIDHATDLSGIGCTYYILKEGLQPKWTYEVGGDKITIDYTHLDIFDEKSMKMMR